MEKRRDRQRRTRPDRRSGQGRREGERRASDAPVELDLRTGNDRRERLARILVTDDEPMVRDVLRRMLEDDGHQVVEAADGREALTMLQQVPIDLAFVDIFLPEMDGLELLAEARREHPGTVFVAMLSGAVGVRQDVLKIAEALGTAQTLTKPFTIVDVRQAVRRAVGRWGALRVGSEPEKG